MTSIDLGGPREPRPCHVESWRIDTDGNPIGDNHDVHPPTTWHQLISTMEAAGGSRPTYDLFDLTLPDGTRRRYRAYDYAGTETCQAFQPDTKAA
ncbi:MAG TPA: hypothetical protein VI172_08125 [Candidatus Dormibacteraeota bacterium]|jgi:hypothetical protein